VSRSGDKTFVGHGGSCPGYRSQLSLQTKDKIAAVFAANALGVTPSLYTNRAYEIMAPAIKKALAAASGGEESASEKTASEEEDPETTLEMYLGTYGQSFGGETAALVWEGKLALVSFPTENPLGAMTKLKHIEGHTFRRIRSDEELGEEISFEVVDGQVVRMWRNNNFTEKVR
jgi:hypothetical protein